MNLLNFRNFHKKIIYFLIGICIALILSLTACNGSRDEILPTATLSEAPPIQVSGDPVRVGILTIDSAVSVNKRYRPLLDYLCEVSGRPFELVPLTQESQFTEVERGNLDFTLNNPLAAVQIQRLYKTKFLVTQSRPKTGPQFSSLIVVRSNSDIEKLEDLKGKKGACVAFQTAAGGCVFQIYHLWQRGIDPSSDFSSFVENKSQDNIVLAVLNGTIDVGFIRTGQLEKMAARGLIDSVEELRVLDPARDDFFYQHTTQLYPEWPVAALNSTQAQLTAEVREALLNIPPDHPALAAAKLEGFVSAVDYTEIDKLIETLKLKSWDAQR